MTLNSKVHKHDGAQLTIYCSPYLCIYLFLQMTYIILASLKHIAFLSPVSKPMYSKYYTLFFSPRQKGLYISGDKSI